MQIVRLSPLRHVLSGLAAVVTLVAPFTAFADDNTSGLEIIVRPGYGSAGSGSPVVQNAIVSGTPAGPIFAGTSSPYGGGFDGTAMLGYRPIRWISFGLAGGYRTASASSVTGVTDLSRTALSAGPYVRGYFPIFFGFETHLGIGAEYMHDNQSYSAPVLVQGGASIPGSFDLVHYGVAIPVSVGIDYRFLRYFAVGPSFTYAEVVSAGGCVNATAPGTTGFKYCANDTPQLTNSNSYGVWSVGLDLRATLF